MVNARERKSDSANTPSRRHAGSGNAGGVDRSDQATKTLSHSRSQLARHHSQQMPPSASSRAVAFPKIPPTASNKRSQQPRRLRARIGDARCGMPTLLARLVQYSPPPAQACALS
ncbi:hypothetical protein P153DRAFT_383466 [Dothidotthia symphoricarpi CBS 119687]|uniref:Uncharacterized protein n=1 Tax=Dothidotthia symphoricarpi CBS 119687 TaxID=1392245 RepID=A0A6A6AJS9_9PLEO|nr:uncharacterized protein P153DRAFT_383466 [Dothidotthia symphoricarpi CBS 119687]KAF2131355.1 hypothetical protein P153DRAFT_383466 [Dothidotthia symphoricarpi CBS 119687]